MLLYSLLLLLDVQIWKSLYYVTKSAKNFAIWALSLFDLEGPKNQTATNFCCFHCSLSPIAQFLFLVKLIVFEYSVGTVFMENGKF